MRFDLLGVILRKEVADNLRDRRAVAMALLFPLLGPVLLGVTFTIVGRQVRSAEEQPLELPVAGAEHAPHLLDFLRASGAEVLEAPSDPEAAVRAGDRDLVLVIPPEFGLRLREGRPAPARLVLDESRQSSRATVERARRMLAAWSHQTGALRLVARGVHPAVAEALALETVDLSTPESRAGLLLSMLPYFLVVAVFVGGMYVAIDTTAGERERQTLEPLLLHPVPREAVALAKVGATALFAAGALAETIVGFGLVPAALPLERLGFSIRLDPAMLLRTFTLFLPLLLLASALQILVAVRARGFKAAQASLSFLMLVPALPSAVLAMIPFKLQAWMMLIPSFGEQQLVLRMVRGETVSPGLQALSMGATLGYALLLLLLATRLFRSERSMFGK
jgi:sodium transport system permease protein